MKTNQIIQGDALELLKEVPDCFAELIIADPPYNIGKDFGISKNFNKVDVWREWCRHWLAECHRILTDNGSLFVYGIHKYICYVQVDPRLAETEDAYVEVGRNSKHVVLGGGPPCDHQNGVRRGKFQKVRGEYLSP